VVELADEERGRSFSSCTSKIRSLISLSAERHRPVLDVVAHQARDALQRARCTICGSECAKAATGRSSTSAMRLVDALFDVPAGAVATRHCPRCTATGWTAHAPGATPAAKRRWPRLLDEATSYEEYRDRLQSQMPDTAVRGPSKIMMVHARVDALSDYAKRTGGSVEDAAPGLPGRAGAPR
jgi:hypothetical protein